MTPSRLVFTLACVFALFSLSSAWPAPITTTISGGKPLVGPSLKENVQAEAMMTIQHSQDIQVCLQRLVQVPDQTQWGSCTFYQAFPASRMGKIRRTELSLSQARAFINSTATIDVINNEIFNWGVGVGNLTQTDNITVSFDGAICGDGLSWNGTDCSAPAVLQPNQTIVYPETPGNVRIFTFTTMNNNQITVSATGPGTASFLTYLRFEGAPSAQIYDAVGNSTIAMANPRSGTWQLAVHLVTGYELEYDDETSVSVTLTLGSCASGLFGPTCISVIKTDASALTSVPLNQNQVVYFEVNVNPLWVSFQPANKDVKIDVYGSIGNLPSPANFIVKGCNNGPCNPVQSIKLDNSNGSLVGNETWIFAVSTPDNGTAIGNNDTTIGVWLSGVCAPFCASPSGFCLPSGECQCEESYVGLDCTRAIGLPSQYIVLIIIAALVVTSAFIGFVAWAYMRKRRRVHYEKVV